MPYDQTVANINEVIDALQSANPDVTMIIEQLAPGRSDLMTPELTTYFSRLQQEALVIASEKTTQTSRVMAVDMFTGFKDSFLADEVHYNEQGASFIAQRYYNVLEGVLKR